MSKANRSFEMNLASWRSLGALAVVALATAPLSWADLNVTSDTTQNSGTLTVDPAGALVVSHDSNDPTLTMTNGANGDIDSGVKAVIIGNQTGHAGTLLINGGSTLSNAAPDYELLGSYGGTDVYTQQSFLGLNVGSIGNATITGNGSSWSNAFSMYVGGYGEGTIDVEEGGALSSNLLGIGQRAESNGTVNVDGADSSVQVSTLWVGGGGDGTLNVTNGGSVSHTSTASIGYIAGNLAPGNSPGTLNIDGDLTWHGGGQMDFELGAAESDLVAITGQLLKGDAGTWNFHFDDAGDLATQTYTLLTFAGTDFEADDFSYSTDLVGFSGEFVVNATSLEFNAVIPEPASAMAFAAVGLSLLARRRRHLAD